MNGRVYDPELGRFLSADPTIQYPDSTQNFNRYSYVNNTPLSYTDPSGFGFFSKLFRGIKKAFRSVRKFLKPVIGIIAAVALTPVLGPVAAGFVSGFIAGGDLKSGIIGALTAGACGQLHTIGSGIGKTLAHGVVGGLSSVAQGGKFGAGFLAGGFTQAASPLIGTINPTHVGPDIGRTVAAAVVGGTASVLGGGKFANGAATGAFSRLFNDDLVPKNPAESLRDAALQDGDLSLSEINEIWRNNNDPNFELTVDASQLTVTQKEAFNSQGKANATVSGLDRLIHGTVRLVKVDGVIRIQSETYDFLPHGNSFWDSPVRNYETRVGYGVATQYGLKPAGTDFLINFSGSPNVQR